MENIVHDYIMSSIDPEEWAPEENNLQKISYLKDTVHFRRRKGDRRFEIVAKSEQEGYGWVCIDVVGTHDEAIASIKSCRGKAA